MPDGAVGITDFLELLANDRDRHLITLAVRGDRGPKSDQAAGKIQIVPLQPCCLEDPQPGTEPQDIEQHWL